MLDLDLELRERVLLWTMIGNHQVSNLKEASVFLRIIERLRLSDTEMRELQFFNDGRSYHWNQPSQGYGDIVAQLEDEEAKALAAAVEAAPVMVRDAAWMQRVVDRCKAKEAVTA